VIHQGEKERKKFANFQSPEKKQILSPIA